MMWRKHIHSTNWFFLYLIPGQTGIWKRWFLRGGENRSTRRKTSRSKGGNQQQTQPAYLHRRQDLNPGHISGCCPNETAPLPISDVVYARTWEVLTLKNPIEPPQILE